MDNVEQLKQDNEKLQERLNNAAKFFREQKAQIETLTKENTQLKEQINSLEFNEESDASVINNYANDNEKLKKTIQNLNNQCNEYELKLELSEKQLKEQKDEYENRITSLEKDNLKLTEDSKLFDECTKKLSNAEAAYEELRKKYKDSDIARNEAELKASNLQSEYEKIFDKQDKEIKDLNTQLKELKQKYENECSNVVTTQVSLDEAKKLIKSKDEEYKVLQNTYNEVFCELHELQEINKRNSNAFEDLNTKFKKLNELYDACESEKLGTQADYENLKEQFEYIKIQEEANREMAAQAEELYEECEKYRNFMKALLQLTKTFNSESLSSIEINEDQNKVSNEVTTPKKERTTNKDTKKIANDKGKNFREQDFPLMSM